MTKENWSTPYIPLKKKPSKIDPNLVQKIVSKMIPQEIFIWHYEIHKALGITEVVE